VPQSLPRGRLHAALVVACLAGLGVVVAAPWAAHRGWWGASLLYALFDPVCHQIAERSFHLWREPLAVCHRCAGLYLGFALGVASWPLLPRRAAMLLLAQPRWILAFAAPLLIDAVLVPNVAASRFSSGLLAAFPVALLGLVAAAQLAAGSTAPTAPPPPSPSTMARRGAAPGGTR
jgi:uncharacterized membrane protein